jgi:hypothetical protein
MTTAATSLLGLALPVTGELSGTWGDTVNDAITSLLDTAVAGTTTLSADSDVTLTTTTLASNQARQAILLWTASGTVTRNITAPAQSKVYIVVNKTGSTQSIVLRGAGPTTGITIVAGEKCAAAWDGTDFVKVASSVAGVSSFTAGTTGLTPSTATTGAVTLAGTLITSNGGTGLTSFTAGDLPYYSTGTALSKLAIGTSGYVLTSSGTAPQWSALSGVAVTTISGGTTGLTPSSATAGAVTLAGTLNVANGGSGATTLTGVLKGNGTSAFSAATAGTDYVAPGTATTFTATQTFSGSSSVKAMKTSNIAEVDTISATAATGTINYDITTQSVLYYTTSASGNWTVNFRGSSGTSLDTLMATGESISATFLVTQGATAYYNSAVTIDGSSVTPKWQGGTAPTSGNASSVDCYTYVIQKTGSATFTVLASQTKFA